MYIHTYNIHVHVHACLGIITYMYMCWYELASGEDLLTGGPSAPTAPTSPFAPGVPSDPGGP